MFKKKWLFRFLCCAFLLLQQYKLTAQGNTKADCINLIEKGIVARNNGQHSISLKLLTITGSTKNRIEITR